MMRDQQALKQTDPLERIAMTLLDQLTSRKLVVSPTYKPVKRGWVTEIAAEVRSEPSLARKGEDRVAM